MCEEQEKLIADTIAAMRDDARLIAVIQTSNARAIGGWADRADAILTTYMPGQEGALALAEILVGKTNPSGKLTQTWPRTQQDTPLTDTPRHEQERNLGELHGDVRFIRMTEGIFTGYRYCDRHGIQPLFPFGHGLSYARFDYSDLSVEETGGDPLFGTGFAVRCRVTNTGDLPGDEVVQLYLGAADAPEYVQMPVKQLAGYARVENLEPGESRQVVMEIDPRMLCYWDSAMPLMPRGDGTRDKWVRAVGPRRLMIGASSADIRLETEIIA